MKTESKKIATSKEGVFYKRITDVDIKGKVKEVDRLFLIRYKEDSKDKLFTVGRKSQGITVQYAKLKRDEFMTKVRLGEDVTIKYKRHKLYTLQHAFDDYLEWAKGNKKTWDKDELLYRKHIASLGQKELTTLKPKDFETIKQKKLKTLSPRTVEYILATARHIINHAIRNDLVKNYTNPIGNRRVRMPKVDNAKEVYLTHEQAHKLLEALKRHHRGSYWFSVLMLFTGARFDEIARLTWQEVDFGQGTIHISPSKNGNPRKVAITPLVEEVLNELYVNRESMQSFVLPNSKGNRWDRIPKQWQLVADKLFTGNDAAGKYRITPHTLRHTHASWLAKNGTDILRIKEQLGHKKLDMTLRYSHLIPDARHEKTKELFERFQDA